MMTVWFFCGLLCGAVGAAVCWLWKRQPPPEPQTDKERADTRKEWVQTRNFLYYDGTEMPVIKEEQ